MLLQFSVTNHRSIKETAIISMKAAADKTMKESKRLIFRYDRKNPRLLFSSQSTLTIHI